MKIIALNEHISKTQRQIAEEAEVSQASLCRITRQHQETAELMWIGQENVDPMKKTTAKDNPLLTRKSKIIHRMSGVDLTRELQLDGNSLQVH